MHDQFRQIFLGQILWGWLRNQKRAIGSLVEFTSLVVWLIMITVLLEELVNAIDCITDSLLALLWFLYNIRIQHFLSFEPAPLSCMLEYVSGDWNPRDEIFETFFILYLKNYSTYEHVLSNYKAYNFFVHFSSYITTS